MLSKFRTPLCRRAVGYVAAGAFFILTGCENTVTVPAQRTSKAAFDKSSDAGGDANYSAEDILLGVEFGDGPVARAIPQIDKFARLDQFITDPAQLKAVRDVESKVLEQIKLDDPAFLPVFASRMRSGNPLEVRDAQAAARSAMLRAVKEMPEVSQFVAKVKANPAKLDSLRAQLNRQVTATRGGAGKAGMVRDSAGAQAALNALMDVNPNAGQMGTDVSADCFIGVWVFYLAFAIDFVAVLSYAAAINVEVVIDYIAAVAAQVEFVGGGGGGGGCDIEVDPNCFRPANHNVMYDQLVASEATVLAAH